MENKDLEAVEGASAGSGVEFGALSEQKCVNCGHKNCSFLCVKGCAGKCVYPTSLPAEPVIEAVEGAPERELPERVWMANPKEGYAGNIIYRQQCSPTDVAFIREDLTHSVPQPVDKDSDVQNQEQEDQSEGVRSDNAQMSQAEYDYKYRGEPTPTSKWRPYTSKHWRGGGGK